MNFNSSSVRILFAVAMALSTQSFAASSDSDNRSATTSAQENARKPSVGINLEPIWLLGKGIGGKVEYFVTDRASVGIGGVAIPSHRAEASSKDTVGTPTYNWEHSEILIGSNYMLTGTLSTNGVYINPAIGYQSTKITEYSEFNLSGELSSPMARLTAGYQWISQEHIRIAAGGGLAVMKDSEVVVKDASGKEVLKQKSSSLGGLALDFQVGYIF